MVLANQIVISCHRIAYVVPHQPSLQSIATMAKQTVNASKATTRLDKAVASVANLQSNADILF